MNSLIEKVLPIAVEDWNTNRLPLLLQLVDNKTVQDIRDKSFMYIFLKHVRAVDPTADEAAISCNRVFFNDNHQIESVRYAIYGIHYHSSKTHVQ